MTPTQTYDKLMAEQLIAAWGQRNIEGMYCQTRQQALEKALALIPPGGTVSCGGSATLGEIGLRDALPTADCVFLDPRAVKGGAEMQRVAREAMCADLYFTSTNAIALTGELVNADGIGNRVAALCYGPKKVLVIAGMNKVVPTVADAERRIRSHCAPLAVLQYNQAFNTYGDLGAAADRAMGQIMVTRYPALPNRITVLLVGEALGC